MNQIEFKNKYPKVQKCLEAFSEECHMTLLEDYELRSLTEVLEAVEEDLKVFKDESIVILCVGACSLSQQFNNVITPTTKTFLDHVFDGDFTHLFYEVACLEK